MFVEHRDLSRRLPLSFSLSHQKRGGMSSTGEQQTAGTFQHDIDLVMGFSYSGDADYELGILSIR